MLARIGGQWARGFLEWTAVIVGAAVTCHLAYVVGGWVHTLRPAEVATEAAVEVAAGFAFAALIATLQTALWVVCGGLRERPAARALNTAGTFLCAVLLLGVLGLTLHVWVGKVGLGGAVAIAVAGSAGAALLGALIVLIRRWWREGTLDDTSANLRGISRRLTLLLPFAFAGSWLAGVRLRPFERPIDPRAARGSVPGSGRRPNIVMVTFDALSAQDMSLYGYHLATTPHMERAAAEGLVFDHFYSASNFTTPTVASLLTGRTVPHHRDLDNISGRIERARREPSVAGLLKRDGYATGAVVANPSAHPLHLGIDDDFDFLPPPPTASARMLDWSVHLAHTNLYCTLLQLYSSAAEDLQSLGPRRRYEPSDTPPELAFALARHFIDSNRTRPFFLWVHLYPPHFPYQPPERFFGRFLEGDAFRVLKDYAQLGLAGNATRYPPDAQPTIDKLRRRYAEYLAYADADFGLFFDWLRETGTLEDAALIVSADHGESFEHGYWGHGGPTMWQGLTHIPLIVRLPGGGRQGRRMAEVSGQIDVAPTLLDLAGIARPDWMDGSSLRPIWEGREAEPRTRHSIVCSPDPGGPIDAGTVATVAWPFKAIFDIASGRGQLYHLERDRHERQDLADAMPDVVARLRAQAMSAIA